MADKVTFILKRPDTGGFTMMGEIRDPKTGDVVHAPTGKRLVVRGSATIERTQSWTWPREVNEITLDPKKPYDKELINYLRVGTRNTAIIGEGARIPCYTEINKDELARNEAKKAQTAIDLFAELSQIIGTADSTAKNEERIRAVARGLGMAASKEEASNLDALYTLIVQRTMITPEATKKVIDDLSKSLVDYKYDLYVQAGLLQVQGNKVRFTPVPGEAGTEIGTITSVKNKLGATKSQEAIELQKELDGAYKEYLKKAQ